MQMRHSFISECISSQRRLRGNSKAGLFAIALGNYIAPQLSASQVTLKETQMVKVGFVCILLIQSVVPRSYKRVPRATSFQFILRSRIPLQLEQIAFQA